MLDGPIDNNYCSLIINISQSIGLDPYFLMIIEKPFAPLSPQIETFWLIAIEALLFIAAPLIFDVKDWFALV